MKRPTPSARREATIEPPVIEAPCSRALGLLAAAVAVFVTTAVIFPLRPVTPVLSTGVVLLLAVLLMSTYWGPSQRRLDARARTLLR